VAATSTINRRWCFCAVAEKRENQKETFWLTKHKCENFIDMSERKTAMVIFPTIVFNRRRLLLRNWLYV
jgi:hypothetical protein